VAELPLLRRFPALARLPRTSLGAFPTPLTRIPIGDDRVLTIKRDDLSGVAIGGNKVRALEWLLGGLRAGDEVLTVGPKGSTHALATATCAAQLGARTTVVRWPQEMNPAAQRVDRRLRDAAHVIDASNVLSAYVTAWGLRASSGARWIPAGGTSPLGMLGYVNAAFELAEQLSRGECPLFSDIVVPLGTGGTAAGLALGLRMAGIRAGVRAVRVTPRVVGSSARVMWLASRTARLIERHTGERVPRVDRSDLLVVNDYYAGGYGRAIGRRTEEQALAQHRVQLDDTYSRKTFAAATEAPGDPVFWLTFDGRLLEE
jgi:1-aminocyclopropane-1-carboxylate deaminase/D-cysteine desulfhydrase-like pyridoxal-dependent ACC family enzyme